MPPPPPKYLMVSSIGWGVLHSSAEPTTLSYRILHGVTQGCPLSCSMAKLLHCVQLPGNSPKITCHLSASTAKQQSPQDNNQHSRWHMGPRAILGVANLAPNTKLGEVQQDANRFVKGGPIAPSKYCGSRRSHGISRAMYTTETCWVCQYRSPTTSFAQHQPLPRARAELREQRDLQRATNDISGAPRHAQSSADVQWTTTNDISYSRVARIRPKIPRRWAPGVGTVGAWVAESPRRARAAHVPRQVLPQGAKTRVRVFADIQNFALRARHSLCLSWSSKYS